mgnify:CR=1 FL=1
MADRKYFYIKNYSKNGEMAVHVRVFEAIALDAIKRVKGVKPYQGNPKARAFNLYHPVNCSVRRDNQVEVKADISVAKGQNVKEVCERVKEEISQSLVLASEVIPFNIKINVAEID